MSRRWILLVVGLVVAAALSLEGWGLVSERSARKQARAELVSIQTQLSRARTQAMRLAAELRRTLGNVQRLRRDVRSLRKANGKLFGRLHALACFEGFNGEGPAFVRGPLRGDIDGDGSPDRAFVIGTRSGAAICRYSLLVLTQHGRFTASIPPNRHTTPDDLRFALGLDALVPLNAVPGDEILVQLGQGASTGWGTVFTLSAGRLVRMGVEGTPDDTFAWSGTPGVGSAVDCVKGQPRIIVGSDYEYDRTNPPSSLLDVTRSVYRAEATSFVLLREQRYRIDADVAVKRFPELYQVDGFESCSGRVPPVHY